MRRFTRLTNAFSKKLANHRAALAPHFAQPGAVPPLYPDDSGDEGESDAGAVVAGGSAGGVGGCTRPPSGPGSIAAGSSPATPTSRPRPPSCSDLYQRRFAGRPLRPDEYVISADEKTSVQARCRCHPTLPPRQARAMRVEHEYDRAGALQYLAAWDCHHAKVFGRCEPRTGIAPFGRLVEQVMTVEPYASARRVFWIADNGSSHRGSAAIQRLQTRWPTLRLIHLPVHASWLNQVEIYFSIVQRKVLTPNDFATLDLAERRLLDFQQYFQQIATPFEWNFTRRKLKKLLERLDQHPQLAQAA